MVVLAAVVVVVLVVVTVIPSDRLLRVEPTARATHWLKKTPHQKHPTKTKNKKPVTLASVCENYQKNPPTTLTTQPSPTFPLFTAKLKAISSNLAPGLQGCAEGEPSASKGFRKAATEGDKKMDWMKLAPSSSKYISARQVVPLNDVRVPPLT